MKVLIADDHDLVRDTLAAFVEREADIAVRAVGSFAEAMETIGREGPFDLVLLDYSMPGMDGLDGLARAAAANAGRPVALISGTATREVAEAALARGAAGFLPKTMPARTLVHAIRFMAAGEQFAPARWAMDARPEAHPLAGQLTQREREVLQGLVKGWSNKEIARALDLKEVTIKLHVKTLCRKLDARNRLQAAMIAKEAGLA